MSILYKILRTANLIAYINPNPTIAKIQRSTSHRPIWLLTLLLITTLYHIDTKGSLVSSYVEIALEISSWPKQPCLSSIMSRFISVNNARTMFSTATIYITFTTMKICNFQSKNMCVYIISCKLSDIESLQEISSLPRITRRNDQRKNNRKEARYRRRLCAKKR